MGVEKGGSFPDPQDNRGREGSWGWGGTSKKSAPGGGISRDGMMGDSGRGGGSPAQALGYSPQRAWFGVRSPTKLPFPEGLGSARAGAGSP